MRPQLLEKRAGAVVADGVAAQVERAQRAVGSQQPADELRRQRPEPTAAQMQLLYGAVAAKDTDVQRHAVQPECGERRVDLQHAHDARHTPIAEVRAREVERLNPLVAAEDARQQLRARQPERLV